MMLSPMRLGCVVLLFAFVACGSTALPPIPLPDAPAPPDAFAGTWQLDKDRSTAIDPWRGLTVEMAMDGEAVVLKRLWRGSREGGTALDSVRVVPGGPAATAPLEQWPDNRHLGAYLTGDSTQTVTARWADDGRTLITETDVTLSIQQGTRQVRTYTEYRLAPDGDRLDVLQLRSTRPGPMHYVFHRAADAR